MNILELLKIHGKETKHRKGEHVFKQGELSEFLYFVHSGLLKAYYMSADGKEYVKSFITAGNSICSLTSAFAGKDCSFSLVCLEDSSLTRIPFSVLVEYGDKFHQVSRQVNDMLLEFSMKKEKREYQFLCLSAEQRYRVLMEEQPEILKQVTQIDIAGYLGITPVALSRIKKRTTVG